MGDWQRTDLRKIAPCLYHSRYLIDLLTTTLGQFKLAVAKVIRLPIPPINAPEHVSAFCVRSNPQHLHSNTKCPNYRQLPGSYSPREGKEG